MFQRYNLSTFQLLLLWLLAFCFGKIAFIAFCHASEPISPGDVAAVLWHGLPMDLSTTAYLLLLPWLCCWVASNWPATWRPLRWVLLMFFALAAPAVVACILGDIALYPFWGFKLDATIWTYIDSPKDAVASVSTTYLCLYLAAFVILSFLLFWLLLKNIPNNTYGHRSQHDRTSLPTRPYIFANTTVRLLVRNFSYALAGGLLFLILRGGVTEATMNVGNAYFSDRQFLNHAAVNPAFSLLYSSQKTEHFDHLYRFMTDEEAMKEMEGLYPKCSLHPGTMRPSTILLIFWEGCGGQLTASLGGLKDITPNLDSLAREGMFFLNFWANSFRTDRGTLSTLSGQLAYPIHSLMKMTVRASHLPSLARTLSAAGYKTSFIYGGDVNFTNMKGYLLSTGFQHITADVDFSLADRSTSKWGVCDSILFLRLYDELMTTVNSEAGISQQSGSFITALTLSSHEPWDVPASYRRPSDPDEKVASFRYTDHHLGLFLSRLRKSELWENLLVIILPDHGVIASDVTRMQEPRFVHIPMVWVGGAVGSASEIPVLMNQSDLPATLLGQFGLPHDDFPWSRDVLSADYTRPFAYFAYNDGFAITASDSLHTTVFYDNIANSSTIFGDAALSDSLTHMGKAILQSSYNQLEELR